MPLEIAISPSGYLLTRESVETNVAELPPAVTKRVAAAFSAGSAAGLLHLATAELQTTLPPAFGYLRDLSRLYLTRLCQTPDLDSATAIPPISSPTDAELATLVLQAPPMLGLEYLSPGALRTWWIDLDAQVRGDIRRHAGGAQAYRDALMQR